MEFHPHKCQVLNITKRRSPVNYTYTIHDHPLETVTSAKYLGVELTNNLSWNTHTENTSKKALRSIGFLRRNLSSCPREIKARCYNTFVRPIAEYAGCACAPSTKKVIAKLESIQKRAARFVMNNYSQESSVTTMLQKLNWQSLEHRRSVAKVSMLYRITNKLIDIPDTRLLPAARTTRGHNQKFRIPNTRTTSMKGTFFPDTIRLWNQLPQRLIDSPNLDVFKTRVRDVMFA